MSQMLMRMYLTLIDPSRNANKHYFIAICYEGGKHVVRTAWGRVGATPQEKIAGRGAYIDHRDAQSEFVNIIAEKKSKGYQEPGRIAAEVMPTVPKWWIGNQQPPAAPLSQPTVIPPQPAKAFLVGKQETEEPKPVRRPDAKWNF